MAIELYFTGHIVTRSKALQALRIHGPAHGKLDRCYRALGVLFLAVLMMGAICTGCSKSPEEKAAAVLVVVETDGLIEHLNDYSSTAERILLVRRVVKAVLMLDRIGGLLSSGGLSELIGEGASTVVMLIVDDMIESIESIRHFWTYVEAVEIYEHRLQWALDALEEGPCDDTLQQVTELAREGDELLAPIDHVVSKVTGWVGGLLESLERTEGKMGLCALVKDGLTGFACESPSIKPRLQQQPRSTGRAYTPRYQPRRSPRVVSRSEEVHFVA